MQNHSHNESKLICDSPLWDNEVFWWTTSPRLTDCFRQTLLITFGPIVLLLLTPFDFRYFVCKAVTLSIPWRPRNVSSAVLNLVMISISFWHLLRSVWKDVDFWSTVFEPMVDFLGLSMAYFLQIYYRRNGRRISIALQVFWLITAVVSIIRLYLEHNLTDTTITHNTNHLTYLIVYCVYISLSVILFLLSHVCDEPSHRYVITSSTNTHSFCALENESALSRVTFLWVLTFLRKGFHRKLQFKDLNRICHSIKAKYVSTLFHKIYSQYNSRPNTRSHRKPKRLLPVLWCLSYKYVLFAVLLLVVYLPALYGQPYILNKLIDFLNDPKDLLWHGIVFSVGFGVLGVISTVSYQQINALMENTAIRLNIVSFVLISNMKPILIHRIIDRFCDSYVCRGSALRVHNHYVTHC
ncbi:unnamed protein product [Oppiella nova]|uniref:Uncharacterized protein n=1 Tax=Oppiella nova TaxID=334625 RepID=A0A7R9LG45_9ACAR|nr:unnamed protein product [Oppiella nova]CAG2163325.1 unnamed protein product [Oppiella nova]